MFKIIIILSFIIIIISIINFKLKYIKLNSTIYNNNNKYLVNNLPDAQVAANILAKLIYTVKILLEKIINENNSEYYKYIKIIYDKLPHIIIKESSLNNKFTSYNINKGQEIVLCLRDKKTYQFHDFNELLYVTLHEIAHIGCTEIGHTDLFISINKFLLKKAIYYNLYNYIDYSKYNKKYCGLILSSTILN
jgi:hypothetical protein